MEEIVKTENTEKKSLNFIDLNGNTIWAWNNPSGPELLGRLCM